MKLQANDKSTIGGFKRAEDGWHVAKFIEGIDILRNKEQEESKNKAGDRLWKFTLAIDDANDESNEVKVDIIVSENETGEQLVVNFMERIGLYDAFLKAFPGDDSVFTSKVMDKIKQKFPDKFIRIKTKQNPYKDKNGGEQIAVNVVAYGKMSDSVEKLEAELSGKVSKKEGKQETKVADDDF